MAEEMVSTEGLECGPSAVEETEGGLEEGHQAWYAEKRKRDSRERTRRCRARKAAGASREVSTDSNPSAESPGSTDLCTSRVNRISAHVAKEITALTAQRLQQYDRNIRALTVEKLLGHTCMADITPAYLSNLESVKLGHSVLSSVREGMREHLVGQKPSKIIMAKDILCTFASKGNVGSGRGVAGLLGVDRRNISKAQGRRVLLDSAQDAFWLHHRRKTRSDSLAENVKTLVEQWWAEKTTVSPNRKDVVTFHEGPRQWISHATHFLQVSQLEFYTSFKAMYPNLLCSLTSFETMKPWWVKRLRLWNTCCCKYHQELLELLRALDSMRTDKLGVHSSCNCECEFVCRGLDCRNAARFCNAHREVYERLTNLWSSILCEKVEFSAWHRRACLLGECPDCGLQLLRICPLEESTNQLVKWKSIGYKVVGTTTDGNPKKVVSMEYRETPPCELIAYLKPKLQAFVLHNYIATWQDFQFRELFGSVPADTLISCVDFSENYTLKVQNEIQSMHWHNDQITILVYITYRPNPAWRTENEEPLLLKEIHYYISDDKTHDSLYVQKCFMLNWEHVRSQGFSPSNHIVWSDGCSGQFKSSRAWYFISRYPNLTIGGSLNSGCQMCWNYFGSGHGKGEVDGAGALLKRELQKEQMKADGRKLQNAAEIVQFLKEESRKAHAGPRGARCTTSKFFWEILVSGPSSIYRIDPLQAETVPGSMANHRCRSVSARDPTLIQYRQLSCFCHACIGYDCQQPCYQTDHAPAFILYRLTPKRPSQARRLYNNIEEVEAGPDGEWIADGLCMGDNVAVRSPLPEEPYWLMLVHTAIHTLEDSFRDPEGNEYGPGDVIFSGFWYERLKEGSRTYLLRNDKEPSSVYSHLLLTSKFSLPPISHPLKSRFAGFELKPEVKEIIDEAAHAVALLD